MIPPFYRLLSDPETSEDLQYRPRVLLVSAPVDTTIIQYCCSSMASFEGKVIALTGAASGIGLACATLLADRGATLSLADLNVAALEKVVQSFKAGSSGRIAIHHVDVRDRQSVRSFYQKTREELGPINGCGNIAGVMGKNSNVHNIWELDPKEWALQMDVNTTGVYNCLAEQLSPGIMAEGGTIVNMASAAGLFGMPKNAAYCASKFAVVGLTKAVAGEGAERGIRVNCVCP